MRKLHSNSGEIRRIERRGKIGRHVALLICLTVGPAACRESPSERFGVEEARSLIPEAAGMDPGMLAKMVDLGAAVTDEDLLSSGSVPLSQLLMMTPPYAGHDERVRRGGELHEWWHSARELALPADFAKCMNAPRRRRTGGSGEYQSILPLEHLKEVAVRRADATEVIGAVTFQCREELGGEVEWTARRISGAWAIVEFRLPVRKIRVRLVGGAWVAEDDKHPSVLPWGRFLVEMWSRTDELPHVRAMRGVPPSGIEIALGTNGDVICWAMQRRVPFASSELDRVLEAPAHRTRDGACDLDVVLRVPASTPWGGVARVLQALRDRRVPPYRVHFAVASAETGEEGVLPCFLPKLPPDARLRGSVRIEPAAGIAEESRVLDALQRLLAETSVRTVRVEVSPGTAAGGVIRLAELVTRAGAQEIALVAPGGVRDGPEYEWPDRSEFFRYLVDLGEPPPGFKLWIRGETLAAQGVPETGQPAGRRQR